MAARENCYFKLLDGSQDTLTESITGLWDRNETARRFHLGKKFPANLCIRCAYSGINKWYSFFYRIVGFKSKGNETSIGNSNPGPGGPYGDECWTSEFSVGDKGGQEGVCWLHDY